MENSFYQDYGPEAAFLEGQQLSIFGTKSSAAPSHNDPFPIQLHWMLEQTEKVGLSTVVGWSPHGRAFSVRDRDLFVKDILPIYFNQTKITSFQRQCSLYGFKRITEGPDAGCYYHPKFLKSSRVFARNIIRTKVKNEGPRKAATPELEPDLYAMPSLPDPIINVGGGGGSCGGRRSSLSEDTTTTTTFRPSSLGPLSDQHQLPLEVTTRLLRTPPSSSSTPASALEALLPARLSPLLSTNVTTSSSSASSSTADIIKSEMIRNRLMTKHLNQQQRRLSLERLLASTKASLSTTPSSSTTSCSNNNPSWLLNGISSPSSRSSSMSSILNDLLPSTAIIDCSSPTMSHSLAIAPEEDLPQSLRDLIMYRRSHRGSFV